MSEIGEKLKELDRLYEQTHGHPWTQMIAHQDFSVAVYDAYPALRDAYRAERARAERAEAERDKAVSMLADCVRMLEIVGVVNIPDDILAMIAGKKEDWE